VGVDEGRVAPDRRGEDGVTLTMRGERMRAEDRARSAWLAVRAREPDPDELDLEAVSG
jgi:hypothetical protein